MFESSRLCSGTLHEEARGGTSLPDWLDCLIAKYIYVGIDAVDDSLAYQSESSELPIFGGSVPEQIMFRCRCRCRCRCRPRCRSPCRPRCRRMRWCRYRYRYRYQYPYRYLYRPRPRCRCRSCSRSRSTHHRRSHKNYTPHYLVNNIEIEGLLRPESPYNY